MKRFFPLLALLSAAPLWAAVPPAAGPNFQVSTTSLESQYGVDVARDAAGDSVFVWIDRAIVPQAVVARVFDSAGNPRQFNIFVEFDNQPLSNPRVAMTPQGEFVVVWANPGNVFLKRFDRLGRPLGNGVITQQLSPGTPQYPDVAIDPAGNVAVVWSISKLDGDVIYLQRFNAANQAISLPEPVNQNFTNQRNYPRVTSGPGGSLLVSWNDLRTGGLTDVYARRYDGPAGAWAPEFRVNESSPGLQDAGVPVLYPDGSGAVVYSDLTAGKILVRRVGAAGAPAGDSIPLTSLVSGFSSDVAVAEDGTALLVWVTELDFFAHARFFDSSWNPLGADFLVSSVQTDSQLDPSVAAGGAGFSVAWTSDGRGVFFPVPVPPQFLNGRDGDQLGVFAQRFQNPTCAGGSEVLCLQGGQFQARVSWRNPYTGETGTGKTLPLTDDTGAFWFFSPDNLELMVKVLDGSVINAHLWVFYGSLSNVEYTLTITHLLTGEVKTYHNAPLQLASRSDVQAFTPTLSLASRTEAEPAAPPALISKAGVPDGDCVASPTVLCLERKMYQVEVAFTDPRDGNHGQGRAIALTDDTGAFWFFGPENLELMVKVLDGHGINGHQWVFFGGLSDVEYTLTVTERATGKKKTYHNARHQQAAVMDLQAF
jgi:hypothetical protein